MSLCGRTTCVVPTAAAGGGGVGANEAQAAVTMMLNMVCEPVELMER